MTDDRGDRTSKTSLRQVAEPPRGRSTNIFDALNMVGVGKIDIAFERPRSHPRPATFD